MSGPSDYNPGQEDWSGSLQSANTLAQSIREYWAAKGKTIRVWVEASAGNARRGHVYSVKSDMVRGLPR